jgi:GntR family transcriptional regulator / MocR family aminotransferase
MTEAWSSSSGKGQDVHLDWVPESGRAGLADAIRAAIRLGRWAADSVVPSTRALAHDLGVARGTVTRVYADLTAEGYLRTSQGAPTRVATAGDRPQSAPRPAVGEPAARWNLMPGHPDLSSFPRDAWLSASRRVLQQAPAKVFGYPSTDGTPQLRGALARYLGRSRGVLADAERIVICGGYSQALSLLAGVLHARGVAEVAFEDPSFDVFRQLVTSAGPRVVGVPVDGDGIQVSAVDSPALVVTPAHQHPLGHTLAPDRRAALTRWATASGATIIEDDYDGEFRFDRQQVGALQALAPERVVYAGTASKTLAPALRLGWLALPRALVGPMRAAMAAVGSYPPALDQLVLAEFLESGAYDRHVRRCRAEYRSRRDTLLTALPEYVTPQGISAGLHLLLMLPDGGPTEADVLAACHRHSVEVSGLGRFWVSAGEHPQGIMVGYGAPAKHAFPGAIRALIDALHDVAP